MRPLLLAIFILALPLILAGDRRSSPSALATSPPSAQRFSIDMSPAMAPANTPSSLGTIETCARIEDNGLLDFDEDLVDTVDLDVVAIGIPASNAMAGYSYTLNYDSLRFRVIYQAAKLGHVQPSSAGASTVDPLPDTDGAFAVSFLDTGPPGSEESGSGVLDSLMISGGPGVQSSTLTFMSLTNAGHIDTNGDTWAPDAVDSASIAYNTFCPAPADLKTVNQTLTFPSAIAGGINATMSLARTVHNNGPANPVNMGVQATFTIPLGCTVDGQAGSPVLFDNLGGAQVSVAASAPRSATVNCVQPASNQISVTSCADSFDSFDLNPGNNCETDVVTFLMDSDGDGWTDRDEAGTPLCGDSRNEDNLDDSTIDDGCPGGPLAEGAFSEAQFNIGLNQNDGCGTDGWPADFTSGGIPDSTNKVTITDLTKFIAPTRRLDTAPGSPDFDARWDLTPGRGLFLQWVNITDLTRMIVVMPPKPPFYGVTRAFGGPACQ